MTEFHLIKKIKEFHIICRLLATGRTLLGAWSTRLRHILRLEVRRKECSDHIAIVMEVGKAPSMLCCFSYPDHRRAPNLS